MAFEGKSFDSIDAAALQDLHTNQEQESKVLDYKAALPGGNDEDKREFLADVSSFANAAGGHIVFGIVESGGAPTRIAGLPSIDIEKEILRLENVIRDGISPRVPGIRMKAVPLQPSPIIVLHIPWSFAAPHMVTFKNQSRFYSRNSAGKYQLDVSEIRSAFIQSESGFQVLRNRRLQRLSDIISGQAPIELPENGIVVLQAIPFSSIQHRTAAVLDSFSVTGAPIWHLKPLSGTVNDTWPNFDGIVGIAADRPSCVQVGRDGTVEAIDGALLRERQVKPQYAQSGMEPQALPHTRWIPTDIDRRLRVSTCSILKFQKDNGVEPPVVLMLSLTRVAGYRIFQDVMVDVTVGRAIDRDTLLLPDVLVEDFSCDVSRLLHPVVDMIWNAAGYPKSPPRQIGT